MMLMVVVVTAAAMAVFMVMMVMLQLRQFRSQRSLTLQRLNDLRTGQLVPGCCDDRSVVIMLTQHRNGVIQLLLRDRIRTGQNDRGCGFDLVIVELSEVLHIHFNFTCVNHRNGIAQCYLVICDLFNSSDHI